MRQVGNLSSQSEAARFAAYLLTEGVSAHTEEDGPEWIVWVHDENQVSQAREAYAQYQEDPSDAAYQGVEEKAQEMLREKARKRESANKNIIQMRGRWTRGGGARRQPLITTLIVISVIVFLVSDFGKDNRSIAARKLRFIDSVAATDPANRIIVRDPLVDIKKGEIWRVVTPIFYHYDVMHIAFNMIMLYQLANSIEARRGTWKLGIMVLAIAAASNLAQALAPQAWGGSPLAGGMSGVVYGALGYAWMKTRFQPELGIFVSQSTVTFLLIVMFFFMTPFAKQFGFNVANWAHAVGLLAGMAIGFVPVLFRR